MNPMITPGSRMLGKPKDWNEERDGICGVLPVTVDGNCCLSVWKFSDEERAQIAAGQNLILSVVGGQPPVNLYVAEISGPVVPLNPSPTE